MGDPSESCMSYQLARYSLEHGFVVLNADTPFEHAGRMWPINADINGLLKCPEIQPLVLDGLYSIISSVRLENPKNPKMKDVRINAISTNPAFLQDHPKLVKYLSETLDCPCLVVEEQKTKGASIYSVTGLDGCAKKEDFSVAHLTVALANGYAESRAVRGLRCQGLRCANICTVFDFNWNQVEQVLNAFQPPCDFSGLYDYNSILKAAADLNMFGLDDRVALEEFKSDPFNWGENHGYRLPLR